MLLKVVVGLELVENAEEWCLEQILLFGFEESRVQGLATKKATREGGRRTWHSESTS